MTSVPEKFYPITHTVLEEYQFTGRYFGFSNTKFVSVSHAAQFQLKIDRLVIQYADQENLPDNILGIVTSKPEWYSLN